MRAGQQVTLMQSVSLSSSGPSVGVGIAAAGSPDALGLLPLSWWLCVPFGLLVDDDPDACG